MRALFPANPVPGLTLPAPGLTRGDLARPGHLGRPEAPGQARGGYPARVVTTPEQGAKP